MKKTMSKIKKKANVFDLGGNTLQDNISLYSKGNKLAGQAALGQGLEVLGGAADITSQAIGNLKPDKYNVANFDSANSFDSLQAQANNYHPELAHTQNALSNALSSGVKGALIGAKFGPWGAAIGGAAGSLFGGLSTIFGNKKQNEAADNAYKQSILNMGVSAQNISNMNNLQQSALYMANGGTIHINPENRGKFNATKERTGKTTEELTHSQNPLTRKRAIFAQNAAQWNHADGGNLFAQGGQTNGVTTFNNGGTHEENPLGGIPQGIGANGQSNLVEQGEVKYRDYIFSNRLKASPSDLNSVGLPKKYAGKTYGEIAKNILKESAERPNDPISQRGLADMMQKLKVSQESYKQRTNPQPQITPEQAAMMQQLIPQEQLMAYGGNIYSGSEYFSSQMNIPWNTKQIDLNSNMSIKNQMFPMAKPNKSIVADDFLNFVSKGNYIPQTGDPNKFVDTSKIITLEDKKITPNIFDNIDASYLRYAPVVASGLQTFSDQAGWSNKADTTFADTISNQGVKAQRLTDKINYKPLDTKFITNQADAQQAATRQGILNTAGGNRAAAMAGLIALNYSGNLQAGQLARQADEYNQAQQQRAAEFNRATNQYNAEADKWEQATKMQNVIQGAQAKEQAIQQAAAVRSANMNTFLNNVTGVGQEIMNRNMITSNPALYYTIDNNGKLSYKQSDVAKYAKNNNMTLAQAEANIKAHAAKNPNYKG